MDLDFKAYHPLAIGVGLFIFIGLLWILIGLLSAALTGKNIGPPMVFISTRTDTAFFGEDPQTLLQGNRPLFLLRNMLVDVLAGFLTLSGLLVLALAWFGLRAAQPWALGALALGLPAALIFWVKALAPYPRAGVPLALGDIPPFMWLPALLYLPAVLLSWLGMR